MTTPYLRILAAAGTAAIAAGALSACGDDDSSGFSVVASFYPLQFVAERIGGDHLDVTNLTAPGAEPHEMELEPQQVADITDADLVVYLGGFQPAVDEAVESQAADTSLNAADATTLEAAHDEHDHGEEAEEEHDHGEYDPHFWLDPTKLDEVGAAVADRLADLDPDNAADYRDNAAALSTELAGLDDEYESVLASGCRSTDLVTSHAAFGYLAERYGLTQVSVAGLTPDTEPRSDAIKQVADYVNEHDVTTVFYETLVDPAVAETIASETGAQTAVLDPIEGLAEGSQDDYVSIMGSNLATLQEALGCQR